METSNCWMALPLLLSFHGQSEAFLVKGENPGEIFFWEEESDAEVLEHQELLSDPIARSTDLLKRSPMVDFFILKTHLSKQWQYFYKNGRRLLVFHCEELILIFADVDRILPCLNLFSV